MPSSNGNYDGVSSMPVYTRIMTKCFSSVNVFLYDNSVNLGPTDQRLVRPRSNSYQQEVCLSLGD